MKVQIDCHSEYRKGCIMCENLKRQQKAIASWDKDTWLNKENKTGNIFTVKMPSYKEKNVID